jgi:hypothetical protein
VKSAASIDSIDKRRTVVVFATIVVRCTTNKSKGYAFWKINRTREV